MKAPTLIFAALLWIVFLIDLHAQGTALTYQGRLNDGIRPANGNYDLRFSLHDTAGAGNRVTGFFTNAASAVSNGLFAVRIDFGPDTAGFDGNARWLEIGVRQSGSTNGFTILQPRQPITATPYAIRAASYSGSIADTQLSPNVSRLDASQTFSGPVQFAHPSNNFEGAFTGNGAGMTNLHLATISSQGAITVTSNHFSRYFSRDVGYEGYSIAADVNGDGHPDLIGIDTILTNNGVGGFSRASSPQMGAVGGTVYFPPDSIDAADVNGDGIIDLLGAVHSRSWLCPDMVGGACVAGSVSESVLVLTNNGRGEFTAAARAVVDHFPLMWGYPVLVTTGDVNGDGRVDMITGHSGSGYPFKQVTRLSVLTNDGTGDFVAPSSPVIFPGSTSNASIQSLASADFNGDGHIDLMSSHSDDALLVATNDGGGNFLTASSLAVGGTSPVAADVNGDGHLDVICAFPSNNMVLVLTNHGHGTFTLSFSATVGPAPAEVRVTDINRDGHMDLISANTGNNTLSILTNDQRGSFALAASPEIGGTFVSLLAADVNADHRVDLICSTTRGLLVLLNLPFTFLGHFDGGFNGLFNGSFAGNGSGLSGLNAGHLVGAVPEAVLLNTWRIGALRMQPVTRYESCSDGVNVIGGSLANSVSGIGGTVSGGGQTRNQSYDCYCPDANDAYDVDANHVSGDFGTVGGGLRNRSKGDAATVSGGAGNTSSGAGGTVGGGSNNTSSNAFSLVPGGLHNVAGGPCSFAAGSGAQALHEGSFVWADHHTTTNVSQSNVECPTSPIFVGGDVPSTPITPKSWNPILFTSINSNEFAVRATGGVRFVSAIDTNGDPTACVALAPGSGAWSTLSDRNTKTNFAPANSRDILEKVAALPLATWNYKAQDNAIRHIGPTAQDFHAAFGVGENDRTITTIDADGVALAAIQGLNQKIEESNARIDALEDQLARLTDIVTKLSTKRK